MGCQLVLESVVMLFKFHECSSPALAGRHNLTGDFLVFLVLQSFCTLFQHVLRALGAGIVL